MSVTTAQAVTLLENVLFESSDIAQANAANWVSQSATNSSLSTVAGLAAALAATPEAGIAQQVVRYYMGALGRVPRGDEIQFYVNDVEQGLTSDQISQGTTAISGTQWAQIAAYFAASPEFATDFGLTSAGQVNSTNEAAVIQAFYANILGRTADSSEVQFYETALGSGTSVATLVQYFTTSPEYQDSVNANIQTALGAYGTSIVNGGSVTQIPLGANVALGSTALTYNGTLNVSAVTVTGTAAAAAQTAVTAVTGVIGVAAVTAATGVQGVTAVAAVTPVAGITALTAVTDGAITINDISSSATGAGTIKSVSLVNSGAGSVINDNGLTSLTLIGTTGALAVTNGNTAAIAAHSATLALTVNGLDAAANTVTDTHNEIATLDVTTATADSVLAGFVDTNLTTLTVAGTNKLTLNAINSSLTSFTLSGAASFSDGATTHAGGLAARGSHLTITDTSTGSFTAALDDTTQSFAGGAGTAVITVNSQADATKTIDAGSATSGNEIVFEGGAYALTSASTGKFLHFQTVGVAANVSGAIDLSVVDPTASNLDVIGANSIAFSKAASGASLQLDSSTGATVTLAYADATGASDNAKVTMSSAVTALTLQDSTGAGVGTLTITNNLGATDTLVSPAHVIGTVTDNGLSTLVVTGTAGLSITTLAEANTPAASFTLNNSSTDGYGVTIGTFTDTALATLAFAGIGTSAIGALNSSAASLAVTNAGANSVTTLDSVGTITDNALTSLSLAANVALGQASTALTTNGLQDSSTAGVTISGGTDNAHVTVNLTAGAATGKSDAITLGNGNNVVVDGSTVGTVTVSLGSGANLVELGGASLDTTGKYSVTFAARTAAAPNVVFVGAAGTTYATAPNLVITGATTGDIVAFGNDSLSSGSTLSATSLASAGSVASALSFLEGAVTAAHQVVYGVYAGNTYIVESGTGFIGATDTAVIEVAGSQTLTASAGYVTLGSSASTLTTGGLSGAGFTIPAGTPTAVTLGTGANVVTLVGPTAGVADTFTSTAGSNSLTINYQATTSTGTDTIALSGSAGANRSDVSTLVVNDTSSGNAGVTIGAFTDNALTSATYANSAASSGSVVTQQALTSSSLNTINFIGGTAGKTTNTYFFTGTRSTPGALTVNDSNAGTGTATMGLTLTGGPSSVSINMTSPGALAVGTLSDNNLTALTIAGSGTGTVSVGTLTDTTTGDGNGAFTVTDTSTSTGGATIALSGLSAVTSLTINDTAIAALADNSAYSDNALTSLTLKNVSNASLTVGAAGISANSLASVSITGSGTGGISTGILADTGTGALTITDTSSATGGVSLPLDNVSGSLSLTVLDSAAGALTLGNLTDNALTSLSLSNTGTAALTLGTVTVNSLNTFNFTLGGTGSIVLGNITDTVTGPLTVNDTSTSTAATTLTFASVPNATSFTVNDNANGALTIASFTDNNAAGLIFNNSSAGLLKATVIDSAPTVTVTLGGSGNGSEIILLTSGAGNGTLNIVDTSSAAGASNVTPTLIGGPSVVSVTDSGAAGLTIAAVSDDNLATVSLTSTGHAVLNATSFGSAADGTFSTVNLAGTSTITTIFSATSDTAAAVTINDSDTGSASIGALLVGSATTNTNGVTVHNSGSGSLSISSGVGTDYLRAITLDNTGTGTTSVSLVDGVTGSVAVGMTGSGTQTLTLTHNGINSDSFVLGAGRDTLVINNTSLGDAVHVTFGTGTGTISMTAGRTAGSTFTLAPASGSASTITAVNADNISHFLFDSASVQGDTLSGGFTATSILSSAEINVSGVSGWTVSANGMASNSNANNLNFFGAVLGASTAGLAAFVDGSGTWIAYTDGAHHVSVVELVGVTAAGLETGATLTSGYIHLA